MEYLTLFLFVLALILGSLFRFFPVILMLSMTGALLLLRLRGGASRDALKALLRNALSSQKELLLVLFLSGALSPLLLRCGSAYAFLFLVPRPYHAFLFLLFFAVNAAFGFCTASPFAAAASSGVLCMAYASSLRLNSAVAGGAVLSGIFFGAMLNPSLELTQRVSSLTGLSLHRIVRLLKKEMALPAAVSCAVFLILGILTQPFARPVRALPALPGPSLSLLTLLPPAVILILGLLRFRPSIQLAGGILAAAADALFLQRASLLDILSVLAAGYGGEASFAAPVRSGGLLSVILFALLLCLSSFCVELLRGLSPEGAPGQLKDLAARRAPGAAVLCAAALSSFPALTGELDAVLTDALCGSLPLSAEQRALSLTIFCLLVPALLPWSVTSGVPLLLISGTGRSLFFACFLYLMPCWELFQELRRSCR